MQTKPTKCIIYCRVSTPGQIRNGHGIETQEILCRQWAARNELDVVETFRDCGISGKDMENRPALNEMLAKLLKFKEPHVLLFYDIERLSREAGDFNIIRKAVEKVGHMLATVEGILEQTPAGKFMATVKAAEGQLWREENALKNKAKMIERARQGYWVFQPPFGYEFKKDGHNKVLVAKEPEASIVREAMQGFADARFVNIADVQRFVNKRRAECGLKPVKLTPIKDMLTEEKYTGVFAYPRWDIPVQKWHIEPLIAPALFERIQDRLRKVNRLKKNLYNKDDPAFPLKGYVLCPHCGRPLTGSHSTGRGGVRYPYYQCQNPKCTNRRQMYIQPTVVHKDFETLLKNIVPSNNNIAFGRALAAEIYKEHVDRHYADRDAKVQRISKIDTEIVELFDSFRKATGDTVRQMCEQRINELQREKERLGAEIKDFKDEIMPFDRAFGLVSEFAGNPLAVWRVGDLSKKRLVLNLCFSGKLAYDKTEKFRTPEIAPIFKAFRGSNDNKSNLVPVVGLEPTTL